MWIVEKLSTIKWGNFESYPLEIDIFFVYPQGNAGNYPHFSFF